MLEQDTSMEAEARRGNVQEFMGMIHNFAYNHPEKSLVDFLDLTMLHQEEEDTHKQSQVVSLMTIHSAKGLEFDTVMMAGLEEGMFPMKGYEPGQGLEEIEEERRLAYVAITRAQKHLLLTYTDTRYIFGQRRSCYPSRFLYEMPSEEVCWVK